MAQWLESDPPSPRPSSSNGGEGAEQRPDIGRRENRTRDAKRQALAFRLRDTPVNFDELPAE